MTSHSTTVGPMMSRVLNVLDAKIAAIRDRCVDLINEKACQTNAKPDASRFQKNSEFRSQSDLLRIEFDHLQELGDLRHMLRHGNGLDGKGLSTWQTGMLEHAMIVVLQQEQQELGRQGPSA